MHSVVLARRPQGNPVEADFAVREAPLPEVTEGWFLTRNTFVSLDAGFRNWMNEDSGDEVLPAMGLDEPVMGLVLAEVLESKNPDYTVGDKLMARFAWQTHSLSDGSDFIARLPARLAPTTAKKSRFFKIFCRSPSSIIIDHKTNLLSGYLTNSTVWMAISNSSFVAMMSTLTVLSCA